jgi:multisubunit Na+/H+ antiporter MnhE subunit
MNINISMRDVVFGYYLYVLIAVFLAAFIFRPYFLEHKNLRRIILMFNILNIIFYTMIVAVSVLEKVNPVCVLKTVWNGNGMYETAKKVN